MKKQHLFALALAGSTALTFACSQAPTPPTSPAGAGPVTSEMGPDGSTLKVTAPTLVSPIGGIEITDTSPDLVIDNATPRFASNLTLSYIFEVTEEDGRVVYTSPRVPAGANGRTQHEVDMNLDFNEGHTWRAWAVFQDARGPRSTAASFRTFNRFGTPCFGSEQEIVACRKLQYGHIEHHELPEFLAKVAWDLNNNGHEWAPYGRLLKPVGNNCGGYSCDIICSDAGGFQRQWDILIDEDSFQGPVWNRVPEISARVCEPVLR